MDDRERPHECEEWTTDQVAERTGMDRGNVRRWARTHGIEPVGAETSLGRRLLWPASRVWAEWRARSRRPGPRRRSDG